MSPSVLGFLALALVAASLAIPLVAHALRRRRGGRATRGRTRGRLGLSVQDPGRERRAEQRARELLESCVNREEWAMYRDLGFIRVIGRLPVGVGGADGSAAPGPEPTPGSPAVPRRTTGGRDAAYAYLIYPHKPIVAYVPRTRQLLSEYCVEFPDLTGAISGSRLPDSDDVLAKWMALTGDELRLMRNANMHLPGRQVDPAHVRRDLWRLAEWERQRRGPGSVEAQYQ
ncbi:MAG: hypothetical protein H0V03_09750 [Thermoleophilaceae bacterium]|nr:hypothetical protein [Thermoleophilaceae bacterium]